MLSFIKQKLSRGENNPKRVLLVSLQKSGTHLIQNLFSRVGFQAHFNRNGGPIRLRDFSRKKDTYISSHYAPMDDVQIELEKDPESMKIIFMFRDPRDVLVSWFHWVHPKNEKPQHGHMRYMQKVYKHFSDEEIIEMFIANDKLRQQEYNVIEHFYFSRILLFHPNVLKVRFEDLIGPRGGGDHQKQLESIKAFTQYLSIDQADIELIADSLFSEDSATFRRAKVGSYKTFLTPDQLTYFNKRHAKILSQYGYE